MGYANEKIHARIQAAEQLLQRIDVVTCEQCHDDCFSLEIIALGQINGESYRTWLLSRNHLSLSTAMRTSGQWWSAYARQESIAEAARFLLEHQTRLF